MNQNDVEISEECEEEQDAPNFSVPRCTFILEARFKAVGRTLWKQKKSSLEK